VLSIGFKELLWGGLSAEEERWQEFVEVHRGKGGRLSFSRALVDFDQVLF
jgi:hypothetical protein